MTAERRPLAMPHVDDDAPSLRSGARAGLALAGVSLLAPTTGFLGVLTLVAVGDLGMTLVLGVLTLGVAVATIVTLGWGAGRLSASGRLIYLALAVLLVFVTPRLMFIALGNA